MGSVERHVTDERMRELLDQSAQLDPESEEHHALMEELTNDLTPDDTRALSAMMSADLSKAAGKPIYFSPMPKGGQG